MAAQISPWTVHEWTGSAADFHALDLGYERAVWVCHVTSPALILGSSQPLTDVDSRVAKELGVDVVRRRSGGGAVFVHPRHSMWIDITIPKNDPLWVDDVSSSMVWVGEMFVRALAPWVKAEVYTGVFRQGDHGATVCFASTSPGEVFVGEHKLVGISQRRTRDGARFQCVLYSTWDVNEWLPALHDTHDVVREVSALHVATVPISPEQLVSGVLVSLPL